MKQEQDWEVIIPHVLLWKWIPERFLPWQVILIMI